MKDTLRSIIFKFFKNFPTINNCGTILMYHRVLPEELILREPKYLRGLCVSTSRFEEQIKFLSNEYDVVSIEEFNNCRLNKKTVIVSFDDGYKDNYVYAYPVLKKYSIPFTIYISTAYTQRTSTAWWCELAKILDSSKNIEFRLNGINYRYLTNSSEMKQKA